jgi:hypothetical protein
MFDQHRAEYFYHHPWVNPWIHFCLETRLCCYGCVDPILDFLYISICQLACMPVVVSTGYIRLVSRSVTATELCDLIILFTSEWSF